MELPEHIKLLWQTLFHKTYDLMEKCACTYELSKAVESEGKSYLHEHLGQVLTEEISEVSYY